jgi:hypothetical protein
MSSVWRALAGALLLHAALAAAAGEHAGVVKVVRGEVVIERSGAKTAAAAGARVHPGDRVLTGRDGQVGITLRDNTLLSAGPNSALVLDRFGFDTTTHAGVIDASLERGTLAVTTGQIVKQWPDAARFRTPNAILGVRGTAFVIDAGQGAP